jgi:hypothetical protein
MALAPPTPVTDLEIDPGTTNHTTPYTSHIYSPRALLFAHPSSIVVVNGSILPVMSVGNSMLPRLFYLNDVLVASGLPRLFYLNDVLVTSGLAQSLLSVRRFTTDNSYSM